LKVRQGTFSRRPGTTEDHNSKEQQQRTSAARILAIRQRTNCRRGYWWYNRGQQQRTLTAKDTGVKTKDHKQKRILKVFQRATIEGLSCKGYGRYDKGPLAEEDTGGVIEANNKGPQLQRILEIRLFYYRKTYALICN
jgi:hypothetical protein